MKKFILILTILLFGIPSFSADIKPVLNNTELLFSPNDNIFSIGAPTDNKISISKKTSTGTGNYSIYTYNNNETMLGSDYEFLFNGRLIACHNAALKLFEVIYNGKNFEEKQLTDAQIQEIFPDAEIIKISQFNQDKKLTVKKHFLEKKNFLLLNDTDKYFHKYSFHPQSVKFTPVAGLFKASSIGKITFSHFGTDKYTIYVKNNFRKQK